MFVNGKNLNGRMNLIKDKYPDMKAYDEDKWLNEALSFSRDAAEVPEYDPVRDAPTPFRAYHPRVKQIQKNLINLQ